MPNTAQKDRKTKRCHPIRFPEELEIRINQLAILMTENDKKPDFSKMVRHLVKVGLGDNRLQADRALIEKALVVVSRLSSELNRIGHNINQMTMLAHNFEHPDAGELKRVLSDVNRVVAPAIKISKALKHELEARKRV